MKTADALMKIESSYIEFLRAQDMLKAARRNLRSEIQQGDRIFKDTSDSISLSDLLERLKLLVQLAESATSRPERELTKKHVSIVEKR